MGSTNDVVDVSRASMVVVPTLITAIVALVLTGLRLWVRIHIVHLVGWDDFFNVLAMVRTSYKFRLASSIDNNILFCR